MSTYLCRALKRVTSQRQRDATKRGSSPLYTRNCFRAPALAHTHHLRLVFVFLLLRGCAPVRHTSLCFVARHLHCGGTQQRVQLRATQRSGAARWRRQRARQLPLNLSRGACTASRRATPPASCRGCVPRAPPSRPGRASPGACAASPAARSRQSALLPAARAGRPRGGAALGPAAPRRALTPRARAPSVPARARPARRTPRA